MEVLIGIEEQQGSGESPSVRWQTIPGNSCLEQAADIGVISCAPFHRAAFTFQSINIRHTITVIIFFQIYFAVIGYILMGNTSLPLRSARYQHQGKEVSLAWAKLMRELLKPLAFCRPRAGNLFDSKRHFSPEIQCLSEKPQLILILNFLFLFRHVFVLFCLTYFCSEHFQSCLSPDLPLVLS